MMRIDREGTTQEHELGPIEELVLLAWGVGTRIDTDIDACTAQLATILDRARKLQTYALSHEDRGNGGDRTTP